MATIMFWILKLMIMIMVMARYWLKNTNGNNNNDNNHFDYLSNGPTDDINASVAQKMMKIIFMTEIKVKVQEFQYCRHT